MNIAEPTNVDILSPENVRKGPRETSRRPGWLAAIAAALRGFVAQNRRDFRDLAAEQARDPTLG